MCKFCGCKHVFKKNYVRHEGKLVKDVNHFSVKCMKVNMVERNLYDESSDEEFWLNVNSLNCNCRNECEQL